MNELAHSISSIEQVNKSYVHFVSDNGLHPVTWLSCPSGKAITYFLTYIGLINKCVPLKFRHLGWYRYFVWPMDYDRHYEYYILPASKEYLADIVLLTMYNVDNMDLLSITTILHRTFTLLNRAK